MALLPCLNCDKNYGEAKPKCPYCGTTNFFQQSLVHNDAQLLSEATKVTISQVKYEDELRQKNQLKELKKLQPPTTFLQKVWYAFCASDFVATAKRLL